MPRYLFETPIKHDTLAIVIEAKDEEAARAEIKFVKELAKDERVFGNINRFIGETAQLVGSLMSEVDHALGRELDAVYARIDEKVAKIQKLAESVGVEEIEGIDNILPKVEGKLAQLEEPMLELTWKLRRKLYGDDWDES